MLYRLVVTTVIVSWLASMSWLVYHDVIPMWVARDVPRFESGDWLVDGLDRTQARIEDRHGRRIGTVWTVHTGTSVGLSRQDVLMLDRFPLAPPFRLELDSDFDTEGMIDTFKLQLFGFGESVKLEAERYSGHLAFQLFVGPRRQLFKLDADTVGMVADMFRPFPVLPDIEVGQSWRLNVINPLAVISGVGSKMINMIVKVTGEEVLQTDDGPVTCLRVEADNARGWVTRRGMVVRQEVDLPVGGTIAVVAEPFDRDGMSAALAAPLAGDRRRWD